MNIHRSDPVASSLEALLKTRDPVVVQLRCDLVEFPARNDLPLSNVLPSTRGLVPRKGLYRILVCRPDPQPGSLLPLTPLLLELAREYAGAQVDLVVTGEHDKKLFSDFPNVGTVYVLPRHALRQPWKFLRAVHRLRQQHYDLAIDPDVSSRCSRMLVNHCWTTYRIGFSGRKSSGKLDSVMPMADTTRQPGQLAVALLRWAIEDHETQRLGRTVPVLTSLE